MSQPNAAPIMALITDPAEWILQHEISWGVAGVRGIAEKGVSPFAWNFNSDRAEVQRLARLRVAELEAVKVAL